MVRRGESASEAQQAINRGLWHYRRRNLVRGGLRILVLMALGALLPIVLALLPPNLAEKWIERGQEVIARVNERFR